MVGGRLPHMMTRKPGSVEEYLSLVESAQARDALERVRAIIRCEMPDAEETISYGIPTFKQNGMIASYAAFANHCSFFPGAIVEDFADELRAFTTSKGTIQFTPERPLPEDLIRRMVRANLERNLAKKKRKS